MVKVSVGSELHFDPCNYDLLISKIWQDSKKLTFFDHFDFTTECFFHKIAKIREMETFSNFLLQIMILRLSFLEKPTIEIDKI